MNKPLRVSQASEKLGAPAVEVPEFSDEIIETFEKEYYQGNPEGAKRDIARFALQETQSDTSETGSGTSSEK